MQELAPIPPQHHQPVFVDFRHAAYGLGDLNRFSCKRKFEDIEREPMEVQQNKEGSDKKDYSESMPLPKRSKTNCNTVGVGVASNRPWKVPSGRASSVKRNPLLTTSWEDKMVRKAESQKFRDMKKATMESHKAKLAKARGQRAEAKARKEENRKKSNVTQVISSNATLRKMMKSKKQRKLLQKADTLGK